MKSVVFTIIILSLTGRISSYKPGEDGFSGKRLAGARCLNLPKKMWDHHPAYPMPVCAMRAGCEVGSIRFGDLALVRRSGWRHWCIILDSGPWGCLDQKDAWHNCGPKTKYKGKLPKGWAWKSLIDVAAPGPGYPGGGAGKVTVIHFKAKKAVRRQIIMEML